MKQVSIENIKDSRKFGAIFKDDIEQQSWIDDCIVKNCWGIPERIVNKEPVDYDLEDVAEEIPAITHEEDDLDKPILDAEGNIIGYEKKVVVDEVAKVKLACQYTITIVDLSTDPEYLLEKELRKAQHRMSVCKFVIERVSARNKIVGMTPQEMQMFLSAFEDIIKLLQVGQLDMARAAIAAVQPVGGITQAELDLIVSICDAGLVKEGEIE